VLRSSRLIARPASGGCLRPVWAIPTGWIGNHRQVLYGRSSTNATNSGAILYLTISLHGAFYGWPFGYYGQHVDTHVPDNTAMIAKALVLDYARGNHVAPLGLTFYEADLLPSQYHGGAFIGEYGS
jgi:hypothetical protein